MPAGTFWRSRLVLIAIEVALASTTVRAALEAPSIGISVAARSIQPGELVVRSEVPIGTPTDVPGAYRLAVRRPGAAETVRAFDATLWVLWDEGEASEKLTRIPVHLASGMHGVELTLNARELGPPRPITVVAR